MKKISSVTLILIIALPFLLFGAFLWGKSTSPHSQIDLVWNEIPDAVTIGWSVDEDDAIVVYLGGAIDGHFEGGRWGTV